VGALGVGAPSTDLFWRSAMSNTIAAIGLVTAMTLSLFAAVPAAAAATYKNDYIPKRSDSYRQRIGHMENESKQRSRAGAEYMRLHHRSLF
jgi:hypothetical protein